MTKKKVGVFGAYVESEGYPNVLGTLRVLRNHRQVELIEYKGDNTTAIKYASKGKFNQLKKLFFSLKKTYLGYRLCRQDPELKTLYLPYPSIFALWFIKLFGFKKDCKIVVDFFIGLYDTIVWDRRLVRKGSRLAKLIYWFEKKSLEVADVLITDTLKNADFYSRLYNINKSKFSAQVLFTIEFDQYNDDKKSKDTLEVLYVGTFVPLHGIDLIAEAIAILASESKIKFTIIGNGQCTDTTQSIFSTSPNCTWLKEWQPMSRVNQAIRDADVCLGIFGRSHKSKRVIPLKVYSYLEAGAQVITGTPFNDVYFALDNNPVYFSARSADGIASALSDIYQQQTADTQSARRYYHHFLSNEVAQQQLLETLLADH